MTEEEAYATFARLRWPDGPVCPRCACLKHYDIATRRRFKCADCGHQFSVTSGTEFDSRKLSFGEIIASGERVIATRAHRRWKARPTIKAMEPVPLSALTDKIVRPGFERFLKPLIMYRGHVTLGQAHRMWNLIVSGMLHEATIADMTQRLPLSPDYSQLCGPEKRKQAISFYSFLTRLEDNPKVMAEMPGLAEYVDWLGGHRWQLTPVSETTYDSRHMGAGGWRYLMRRPRKPRAFVPRVQDLLYPFLIHDAGKPEHTLLRRVTTAVRTSNPDLKADLCQDLIVGILAGEFAEHDLALPAREVARRASRLYPDKYKAISLDVQHFEDGEPWLNMIADEGRDWA